MRKVFSLIAMSFSCINSQEFYADPPKQFVSYGDKNLKYITSDKFGIDLIKNESSNFFRGRAQYRNDTHWGTICDNGIFDISDADQICKSVDQRISAVSWTNVGNLS